jgi:hypothetical protein
MSYSPARPVVSTTSLPDFNRFNVLMELGAVVVGRENLKNCAKATFERKRARLTKLAGVSEGI